MFMMKKILVILLTICLITTFVSVCAVPVYAQETHTVTFDTLGIGKTPDPVQIADGEKYLYLGSDNVPKADGYVFHCWATTPDYPQDEVEMSNTVAYLETPVTEDMTLYAVWYKLIDSVDVVLDPPVSGSVIGKKTYSVPDYSFDYQYPQPHPTVSSEGAQVRDNFWSVMDLDAFWLKDPNDFESVFEGTFESGKTYGVHIIVEPKFGYQFTEQVSVAFNGEPIENFIDSGFDVADFLAPIRCVGAPSPSEVPTSVVKATKDSATPDSKSFSSSSGANPYAVNTGNTIPAPIILLLLLAGFGAYWICRRKTN